jgi:hypothetical protein
MEETVEYQRKQLEVLQAILAADLRIEALQIKILKTDEAILKQLISQSTDNDITSLGGSISTPVKRNP